MARPTRSRRKDVDLPDWSLGDPALGVAPERGAAAGMAGELSDRELALRREYLREYVRGSFEAVLTEEDVEDVVQTAWVALLTRRSDEPIRDLRAFMGSTVWRTANGYVRRPRPVPLDPHDSEFTEREDPAHSSAELVAERARLARLGEALAQLSRPQREAYWARFVEKLGPDEACELLGISRAAYYKRLRAALARIDPAIEYESEEFTERQRELLSDYVAGIATDEERARAERLIAADPQALVMARELRRTHEDAAVLLPLFVFAAAEPQASEGPIGGAIARLSETISGWLGRTPSAGELASSPALASGGARGAGVAGTGVLAKALGGLGAGNIALGCLGGGAVATIACVATGVLPLSGGSGEAQGDRGQGSEKAVGAPQRAARGARLPELIDLQPAPAKPPDEKARPTDDDRSSADSATSSSAPASASTLEPDVAPEVQEFGVAGAGTPVGGAPPDTNEADGASASSVREQFGP